MTVAVVTWENLSFGWIPLAATLCLVAMTLVLQRQIGGYTGDALGATQQLSEVLAYVGLVWVG